MHSPSIEHPSLKVGQRTIWEGGHSTSSANTFEKQEGSDNQKPTRDKCVRKSLAKIQELQIKETPQEGSRHRQFRHSLKPKLRTAGKAQDEAAVNIGVKLPQIERG